MSKKIQVNIRTNTGINNSEIIPNDMYCSYLCIENVKNPYCIDDYFVLWKKNNITYAVHHKYYHNFENLFPSGLFFDEPDNKDFLKLNDGKPILILDRFSEL